MNRPIEKSTRLQGLYVITQTPNHTAIARAALRGGARLIQIRDHETAHEDLLEVAGELRALTRQFDALFFVCDHIELALEVGADGVHLEWSKVSLPEARQRVGKGMLLSTGVGSVESAIAAQDGGADYLGSGPVFSTKTKLDAGEAIGFVGVNAIRSAVSLPLAAIGGLNASNIGGVPTAMASVVSALSDLENEEQMEAMTRTLIENLGTSHDDS
jgi:thiamine-phosphate pyrophosphorylase